MDSQDKFDYWLDIAQYDLSVAESMLNSGHWLYVVFMCQQAVEKLTKGLYSYYMADAPPHLHNIKTIVTRIAPNLSTAIPADTMDFFDGLTAYYINTRYPGYVTKVSEIINKAESEDVLRKTKEVSHEGHNF